MFVGEYGVLKGKTKKISELTDGSNYRVQVQCPECGYIRWASYFTLIRNGHHYCRKCALRIKLSKALDVGSVFGRLIVVQPSDNAGKSICECECGNIKEYDNYSLTTGRTNSCGCLKKENFINVRKVKGAEHGMWKGGIASERQRIMATKKYKDWRRAVFERDNYTCQKCGQHGRDLNAHHINNFADYEDKRFLVDNGITFCRECHIDFHKIYGQDHTDEKMLDEFINDENNI